MGAIPAGLPVGKRPPPPGVKEVTVRQFDALKAAMTGMASAGFSADEAFQVLNEALRPLAAGEVPDDTSLPSLITDNVRMIDLTDGD